MRQNETFKPGQKVVVLDNIVWDDSEIIERDSPGMYKVLLGKKDTKNKFVDKIGELNICAIEDKEGIIKEIEGRICYFQYMLDEVGKA